jgi:hypothetical protein
MKKDYFSSLVVTWRIIFRWIVIWECEVDFSGSGYTKCDKDDVQRRGSYQALNCSTNLITASTPSKVVIDDGN